MTLYSKRGKETRQQIDQINNLQNSSKSKKPPLIDDTPEIGENQELLTDNTRKGGEK